MVLVPDLISLIVEDGADAVQSAIGAHANPAEPHFPICLWVWQYSAGLLWLPWRFWLLWVAKQIFLLATARLLLLIL